MRVRGPIWPDQSVCATTDTAQEEKRLFKGQNQAILTSDRRPLGECRVEGAKSEDWLQIFPSKACLNCPMRLPFVGNAYKIQPKNSETPTKHWGGR
jgi:hypothetical protein